MPVDRIKIDKSFVQQLTVDESRRQARAMIEAMVALARALGMKTIAEGVENEAQLAFVRKLGCDAAQGYFIGRPVPAAGIQPHAKMHLAARDTTRRRR
ncbi:EAL domain-containing protein [Paraburkholderia bengalensis]|uniref:EAL domain-containing protein n=1 Tax=Paraburkholderia bengalensis TaxID=2747562 RepID=A0ABU8ILM4_9BURK